MLKLFRLGRCCSTAKPPTQNFEMDTVLSYYQSGKSYISISQHVVSSPKQQFTNIFPNFYIHHQKCVQAEQQNPNCIINCIKDQITDQGTLMKVFRIIISANIGNKDLGLDINSLKANPCIQRLIQLKENKKFVTKTSQIIIEDIINDKIDFDTQALLTQGIKTVENQLQTHLGLPISYMISKGNVLSPTWLKVIAKKKKAIHSDVIECAANNKNPEEKKSLSLEEIVYNHGFRLQHLFLRPYSRGCPTDLLAENDSFNLQELLKVLSIIDFSGKIILQNTDKFYANVQFLDLALKKCGYVKRKSGRIDLIDEYMII